MPGSARGLSPQDLHRRRALETLVEGIEDPGHAALAQDAVDPVPPSDQGRRARLHRGCVPRAPVPVVVAPLAWAIGPNAAPGQPARAAISPMRVNASDGDPSPKSR